MDSSYVGKAGVKLPVLSRDVVAGEAIVFVIGVSGPGVDPGHAFCVSVHDEGGNELGSTTHRSEKLKTSQNRAAFGAILTVCDTVEHYHMTGRIIVRTAEQYLHKYLADIIREGICRTKTNDDLINLILESQHASRIEFEAVRGKSDPQFKKAQVRAKEARTSVRN